MATPAKEMNMQPRALRRLLACGIIAPLFFIVAFLIAGAVRPGYDPLRQPVSSLSIGAAGWTQIANFLITGSLLIAFAVGLRRALRPAFWGPLLIGLAGLGLVGAGLFVADPLNGYPPGAPLVPVARSTHGRLHDLFGVPVFLGLPIAGFVFTRLFARRGERGWAVYSFMSALAMFVLFVVAGMGFNQTPGLSAFAGVFQRLSLAAGLGWVALLADHLRKLPVPNETVNR